MVVSVGPPFTVSTLRRGYDNGGPAVIETAAALLVIVGVVAGYRFAWTHSRRVSIAAGRPRTMTVGFAIAAVAFMPITLMYWAARRLLLGS